MDLFTEIYIKESIEKLLLPLSPSPLSQETATVDYSLKLQYSLGDEDCAKMFESYGQDRQKFFLVPKLLFQQLHHKKNETVAVFIDFLLQLLYHETDPTRVFGDGNRIDVLKKELRFLIIVLGDEVLLSSEVEKVDNLLVEFEAVANEAGRLVYSLVYSTDEDDDRGIRMDTLLEHIELLKSNITSFSIMLSCIGKPHIVNRNTASVPSLYIVDSLVHDLEDLIDREDDQIVDELKGQMKILHQELILSQSLLKDINLPRNLEVQEMKEIVMQIRDLAFEAEYVINSFLVGDAPIWYLTIRLTDVIHKVKFIGSGMKEIKKSYDVGALKFAQNFSAKLILQLKRNSDIIDDIIVGFDEREIDILDLLVRGTERLQVITIFGMPGLGKTTLAKKLYKHPSVYYHFDKSSWCVVSQTYDRKNLLNDILMSFSSELEKETILNMEEEVLAEQIYRSLKGRRYIIVIDDIWDSNVWDDLRRYFPDDVTGSRILFTTRNKDVTPPKSIVYALSSLSNDQCWELLEKKVFHHTSCPPQLIGIGKEIAGNCNGLPLAVVVIAGILSTMDKEESTWKTVGERLKSYIFSEQNNIVMQILKLSYKHLPEYLKPCFLYFGAFPEDREIRAKKLRRLWIAEGFIRREKEKSTESIAEEYLLELIDKSLVMVSKRRSDGGPKLCVVHDLLRDLCLKIAEEENFLKLINNHFPMYTNHQRLCSTHCIVPFGFNIRSIFGFDESLPLYVLKMKSLRVMDLANKIFECGGGVEHLVHLRYLAIKNMPLTSIGSLVNLECLTINTRRLHLDSIFSIIHQNMKLRYLDAPLLETSGLDCNSLEINNIEYLSSVSIDTLDEEILTCSPHLRFLKCICLPLLEENGVYRYPDLRFLTHLESLYMSAYDVEQHEIAYFNLPSNLKKLTLSRLHLPWEKASVIGGLPSLQVLKLRTNAFVGEKWETSDGEFQQLKFLQLASLEFAHWNVASREHFPKLEQLVLFACENLQEIPCEIGEITTLQMIEVTICSEAVAESAREIQQEQVDMGNDELNVIIKRSLRLGKVRHSRDRS